MCHQLFGVLKVVISQIDADHTYVNEIP